MLCEYLSAPPKKPFTLASTKLGDSFILKD